MFKCPDRETLEKFIEHELDDARTDEIFHHLPGCDKCKEAVSRLMAEEDRFIGELSAESRMKNQRKNNPTGKCFTDTGLMAYAVQSLSEDQLKLVEKHLNECDNCLSNLMTLQKKLAVPVDLGLDFSQFRPDQQTAAMPGLIEIVLKAKDDLLDLVRNTGELLTLTPQYGAVRGQERKPEESIAIRQDLPQLDLSVEITIQKKLAETGAVVRISLMKLSVETFMSAVRVKLSTGDTVQAGLTNEEGVVELRGITEGRYDLSVGDERVAVIRIER